LHATEPQLLGAGLLIDDLVGWPRHQVAIGTEDDLIFFVLPQAAARARLYLLYPVDQRKRFAGPTDARDFLDSFPLACLPGSEHIAQAKPAGPCAAYPMNDAWTDHPVAEGLALIGDAAGYSDPHIAQGLSIALRDVRILRDLLLAGDDWSPASLQPYVHERAERMRRLRVCATIATKLRGDFGPRGQGATMPGAGAHAGGTRAGSVAPGLRGRSGHGSARRLRRACREPPLRWRRHDRHLSRPEEERLSPHADGQGAAVSGMVLRCRRWAGCSRLSMWSPAAPA